MLSLRFLQPDLSATVTWAQTTTMKRTMMNHLWSSDSSPLWPTASARYCSAVIKDASNVKNSDGIKHRREGHIPPDILFKRPRNPPFKLQVYSSTEHLSTSTPSNQSLSSSERSHSEEKEERWEGRGVLSPGDGHKHLAGGERRADGHRGR